MVLLLILLSARFSSEIFGGHKKSPTINGWTFLSNICVYLLYQVSSTPLQ